MERRDSSKDLKEWPPLLQRKFEALSMKEGESASSGYLEFSVMQFNLLADGLGFDDFVKVL